MPTTDTFTLSGPWGLKTFAVTTYPPAEMDDAPEPEHNEALAILSDLVAWSKYSEAANITGIVNRADALLKKVNG